MCCIVQTLDLKAGEFPCYCGRILCAHCAHLGNNTCHIFSAEFNPWASSLGWGGEAEIQGEGLVGAILNYIFIKKTM